MLKESLKNYGEVADISRVRTALVEIKQALQEKAFIKEVEKDIFIAKSDLEKQINQRVKTEELPSILDKFERNIEFNTRKFVDVDRRVNDCKMV